MLVFAVLLSPTLVEAMPVYGEDDRKELYEIANPTIRELADATVALFMENSLKITQGVVQINGWSYVEVTQQMAKETVANFQATPTPYVKLSPEERFYGQVRGAFCSGVLVGPDIVLTAGHCIENKSIETIRFVFNFDLRRKEGPEISVENVFTGHILAFGLKGTDDWALIRLDRPATPRKPVKLDQHSAVKPGTQVFSISHPVGLPAKVTGNAPVLGEKDIEFYANLSVFPGASGGPVFDAETLRLKGIITRGKNENSMRQLPDGTVKTIPLPRDWSVHCYFRKVPARAVELLRYLNGEKGRFSSFNHSQSIPTHQAIGD